MDEIVVNRILYLLIMIQDTTHMYLGICMNASCGAPRHPHWDDSYWAPINIRERPIYTNFPPQYADVGIDPKAK